MVIEGPTRVCFDLDRDIHKRMSKVLPWGVHAHVYRQLVMMLIEGMEKGGNLFLAALLNNDLKFEVKTPSATQTLNGSSRDEG
jgi:hypothetical protein